MFFIPWRWLFQHSFINENVNLSLCLFKHHVMKTYKRVQVQFHAFLSSALDGISGQLHAPAALTPEKEPPVPTGKEAGWPHNWSGCCGEETNPCPCWESNAGCPARSLDTLNFDLCWKNYLYKFHMTNVRYADTYQLHKLLKYYFFLAAHFTGPSLM
jgi:hypothetical protein